MAVDIAEKKATLEAAYSQGDFTTTFDFVLPVSGEYEVVLDMDENVRHIDEYTRETSNEATMKYSEGALNVHIECSDKQGFYLRVNDSEHIYKAWCHGSDSAEDVALNITTEDIEEYILGEDEDELDGKEE